MKSQNHVPIQKFKKISVNLAMKRSLLSRLAECAKRQVFFFMNLKKMIRLSK